MNFATFKAPSFYAGWKRDSVAIYVASDKVALYNAVEHSIAEINQAIGFDLLVLKGMQSREDAMKGSKAWNRINSVIEVPDRDYFRIAERNRKSLAVTKMITSQDELVEADILIRSSTIKGRYLRATILHELGHVVGLGHAKDTRSFMYPELRNPKRFVLGRFDAQVLARRYAGTRLALRP